VVATNKGNYSETLNAGIAAFRAGEQPDILQVFEVGTATMMAAKGAIKPVYEVMAESGLPFDQSAYLGCCRLLHHHRRPDAVAALQLLHPGSLCQP
jgi:ABC-type glycerol-3-phosphate transport system substrate-binding protein